MRGALPLRPSLTETASRMAVIEMNPSHAHNASLVLLFRAGLGSGRVSARPFEGQRTASDNRACRLRRRSISGMKSNIR